MATDCPHAVADDYVLQLPNTTAGGYHSDGSDGGVECHLALGGKSCMLPLVLPAWTRAERQRTSGRTMEMTS